MTRARIRHALIAGGLALFALLGAAGCVPPKPPAETATAPEPAPEPLPSCEQLKGRTGRYADGRIRLRPKNVRQLEALVRCNPRADSVVLAGPVSDYGALTQLDALSSLWLNGDRSAESLETLPELPQLKRLNIRVGYNSVRPAPSLLDRFPQLQDAQIQTGQSARFILSPNHFQIEGGGGQPWLDAAITRYPHTHRVALHSRLDLSRLGELSELAGLITDGESLKSAPALPKLRSLKIVGGDALQLQQLARFATLNSLETSTPLRSSSDQPVGLNELRSIDAHFESAAVLSALSGAPLIFIRNRSRLEDVRPLLKFPKLRFVELWETTKTAPLSQLQALERVELRRAHDMALLQNAPALRWLSLHLVPPDDAPPLPYRPRWSAPALRHLKVTGRHMPVRWLAALPELTHLKIEVKAGADLRPLANLRSLIQLEIDAPSGLHQSERPDLTPLRDLPMLRLVRLAGCFRNAAVVAKRPEASIRLPKDAFTNQELEALRKDMTGSHSRSGRPCSTLKLAR